MNMKMTQEEMVALMLECAEIEARQHQFMLLKEERNMQRNQKRWQFFFYLIIAFLLGTFGAGFFALVPLIPVIRILYDGNL